MAMMPASQSSATASPAALTGDCWHGRARHGSEGGMETGAPGGRRRPTGPRCPEPRAGTSRGAMKIPSAYIDGYAKGREVDPERAANYVAHTSIGDPWPRRWSPTSTISGSRNRVG